MNGEERREEMLRMMVKSKKPISGAELARHFSVSRQVIVQDIALLRAGNYDILSTNRGYLCQRSKGFHRIFSVFHEDQDILEELNTIVDFGGTVVDVFIKHEVYGELRADLMISTRRKAMEFVEDIRSGKSSPLKNITSGYHYHTVEADSEETLDAIESELRKKNFLKEEMEK